MKIKKIDVVPDNTVGIIEVIKSGKTVKLPGYFNKKLLKKAIKYLKTFPERDISISFKIDANKESACILFWPNKKKKIAVGCAGKLRREG